MRIQTFGHVCTQDWHSGSINTLFLTRWLKIWTHWLNILRAKIYQSIWNYRRTISRAKTDRASFWHVGTQYWHSDLIKTLFLTRWHTRLTHWLNILRAKIYQVNKQRSQIGTRSYADEKSRLCLKDTVYQPLYIIWLTKRYSNDKQQSMKNTFNPKEWHAQKKGVDDSSC